MEKTMKYGARKGTMNFWRRWLAKVTSRELVIFPIPGADLLRVYQSEPMNREARLAESPKEANVLLVIGDLSVEMAERAATIYAQIPRPRVLVLAGPDHLSPLPHPDVHVPLEKDFLETVLPAARECLSSYSWTEEAEPFRPEKLVKEIEAATQEQGHMHDHHGHGAHEGHDHSAHKHTDHGAHEGHDHSAHNHSDHGAHEGHDHSAHKHTDHGAHEGHDHSSHHHEKTEEDHAHLHGEHSNGGHDHGSGFMSMKAMTKDLTRSADGLPMEWSDVQFGPFHPGLPGGLRLSMKLDGDTVVKAVADRDQQGFNLPASITNNPAALPEYLEAVNPEAPVSYRLLAQKALVNFSGAVADSALTFPEAVLLEKERIISHLNWLAVFATTLGSDWMRDQSIKHYHRFQNGSGNSNQLSGFISRIKKMPYLKLKLSAGHQNLEVKNHSHSTHSTPEHSQGSHDHSAHKISDHGEHQNHEHSSHQHGKAEGGHNHSHESHEHSTHHHETHSGHTEQKSEDNHQGHENHHQGHGEHINHENHDHSRGINEAKDQDVVPGQLPNETTGPVARAAGIEKDQRLEEYVYEQNGWKPSTASGNTAWSRLKVRLDEMEQSLRFIAKAGDKFVVDPSQKIDIPSKGMGNGIAYIESPRGIVTLKFHIHEGKLAHFQLTTPSEALLDVIQQVTAKLELADALTAVASLDISPREIH